METIKAIQTKYDGYHFRSRLEAKWAVFFNELNIEYEYEKEGFELSSGGYLPDFWLPKYKIWIELKGDIPTINEMLKIIELHQKTGDDCMIAIGLPNKITEVSHLKDSNSIEILTFPIIYTSRSKYPIFGCEFLYDPILNDTIINSQIYTVHDINIAVEKSKSARFEYGETPE